MKHSGVDMNGLYDVQGSWLITRESITLTGSFGGPSGWIDANGTHVAIVNGEFSARLRFMPVLRGLGWLVIPINLEGSLSLPSVLSP